MHIGAGGGEVTIMPAAGYVCMRVPMCNLFLILESDLTIILVYKRERDS